MSLVEFFPGNTLIESPGIGLKSEFNQAEPMLKEIQKEILKDRSQGKLDWMNVASDPFVNKEILEFVRDTSKIFDHFVVVGIGGSSLGNRTLHDALNHSFHNLLPDSKRGGAKIFYTDTVDPDYLSDLLEILPLEKTLFNVITKSGSTAETMSQAICFIGLLKKKFGENFKNHLVITTDRSKGALQELVNNFNLKKFIIEETVGGRFSVFSPVGLISAAFSGVNIDLLHQGVDAANRAFENLEPGKNPAILFPFIHHCLYGRGYPLSVMMPYHRGLQSLSDWYCQLWAESLGKESNLKGEKVELKTQPIRACGPQDQHSMLQLFIEGGADKIFTFIRVKNFKLNLEIGEIIPELNTLSYLGGKTFSKLINAEQTCTEMALFQKNRPVLRFELEELNEISLGTLMQTLMISTAFAGKLFKINPFDQPGVELGKNLTYGLMERPGFEEQGGKVKDYLAQSGARCIPIKG